MTKAWSMKAICVTIITRRLGRRSTRAPPAREKSSTGRNCRVLINPSRKGEVVRLRISQDWPMACIQVPISETAWPKKNRRKSPWFSATSPEGNRIPECTPCYR